VIRMYPYGRREGIVAAGEGFQAPGLGEFEPTPLARFTVLGVDFAITRMTVILWITTLAVVAVSVLAARRAQVVPGRLQFLVESGYSLVRDGVARDIIGPRGLPFAPFLSALFFFILANNLMSVVPLAQISPMSRFAIPALLAGICYVLYLWTGVRAKGLRQYVREVLFLPGVPPAMHLLIAPIEFLQNFITQPFTLAVRLFANMFAGHMLLVVFSLGATYLFTVGNWTAVFGPVSALMTVVMTFFELMVAFLQAYVFVVLVGTYLNRSLESEH
jgi:F-type H+-transporting ATPase subunit a